MPKMGQPGQQIKVWLPRPVYKALRRESDVTGRPMAEIAREELTERYANELAEMSEERVCPTVD